ncbi:MAG: AsmA-like C-terminal region-containing protein [Alphaproteobacteria bacterium]
MKGKLKYIVIILLLLIFGKIAYLYSNLKKFEPNIVTYLTNNNIKISKDSRSKIKVLPFPVVIVNDVEILCNINENFVKISSPELKINFSFWKLLIGQFKFNALEFSNDNTIIETSLSNKDFITLISNKNSSFPVMEYNLNKVKLILKNDSSTIEKTVKLNIKLGSKKALINAIILKEDISQNININFSKSEENEVSAKIYNKYFSFLMNGKLQPEQLGEAKLNLNIIDSAKFFENRSYIGFNKFYNMLDKANIVANLNFSKQKLDIKDLEITSPMLKASGSGDMNIVEENLLNLKIKFDSLNIEGYSIPDLDSKPQNEINDNININQFELLPNTKILGNVKVENATIEKEKLSNIEINFDVLEKKININSANLILNNEVKVQFEGNVINNKFRSAFEGKISLIGNKLNSLFSLLGFKEISNDVENFDIKTDFFVSLKELRLFNLKSFIGKAEVTGKSSIYFNNFKPSFDFNLKIKDLEFPENLLQSLKVNLKSILYDDNLSRISKLQFLRKIDYQVIADLNFDNLNIGNNKYKYLGCEFVLDSGIASLTHFKTDSEIGKFKSNAILNVKNIEPEVNLNFIADKVDLDALIRNFTSEPNLNNVQIQKESKYGIPEISDIKGEFNFDIKNLYFKKAEYNNIKAAVKIKDNQINIDNFETNLFNGALKAHAVYQVDASILSMAFAFKNVLVEKLFEEINTGILKGYFSSTGQFVTTGKDVDEMISKLQGSVNIAGRSLILDNIDIDSLIEASNKDEPYEASKFQNLLTSFRIGQTKVNNLDGSLKITNGIMQTNSLVIDNNKFRGVIGGSVNLKEKLANIIFRFAFIPKPMAPQINISMKLIGSIDKPSIDLDAQELENYLKSVKK